MPHKAQVQWDCWFHTLIYSQFHLCFSFWRIFCDLPFRCLKNFTWRVSIGERMSMTFFQIEFFYTSQSYTGSEICIHTFRPSFYKLFVCSNLYYIWQPRYLFLFLLPQQQDRKIRLKISLKRWLKKGLGLNLKLLLCALYVVTNIDVLKVGVGVSI